MPSLLRRSTRWGNAFLLALAGSGMVSAAASPSWVPPSWVPLLPVPGPQGEAVPAQQAWPWASTLSRPITLGISSEDRSLFDEELRRLAEILGRGTGLPVELASKDGYKPGASYSKRKESALVALDQWDSEAESTALSAGVNVMFVVTSASARKGKKVKKKYVPIDKSKGDQKGRKVEVTSLLYKFQVEVWALEPASKPDGESGEEGSAASWVHVSTIRRDGERDYAPMFVAADTKKVTWDLADVVGNILYSELKRARVKLAADWPVELDSASLADLYGTLDAVQRTEFWQRTRLASPVSMGLSVEALLDLALEEWERANAGVGLDSLRDQAKGFVNDWISSSVSGWMYQDRPPWLQELMGMRFTGPSSDVASAAVTVEDLLDSFRSSPPMGISRRKLPALLVVAPEDVGLAAFAEAAPDPIRFYRAAALYSDEDYDKVRKSKSRWLKNFNGVQVLLRYGKGKPMLKQSVKSLDTALVLELVFEEKQHRWPGKPM